MPVKYFTYMILKLVAICFFSTAWFGFSVFKTLATLDLNLRCADENVSHSYVMQRSLFLIG